MFAVQRRGLGDKFPKEREFASKFELGVGVKGIEGEGSHAMPRVVNLEDWDSNAYLALLLAQPAVLQPTTSPTSDLFRG